MKKVLFFLFVLLMSGSALADNPTDTIELSQKPVIICETLDDGSCVISITSDVYAEIYYAITLDYADACEYYVYDGPITVTERGTYRVSAFAVEPGKAESEIVEMVFCVADDPQPWTWPDAPNINITQLEDGSCEVTITPEDIGGQIFYHVDVHYGDGQLEPYGDFESLDDYKPYPGTLYLTDPGHYIIGAYTCRPGEARSYMAYDSCTVAPVVPELEKTEAPGFMGEDIKIDGRYAGCKVSIIPTDYSVPYFRLMCRDYDTGDWNLCLDWQEYTDPICLTVDGLYRIEAYAVAEGKEPSDQIAYEVVVRIPVDDYDFEEDGIFYKITSDGMVSVTSETNDHYTDSYSGDVVIPDFVTHDGVTYQVWAIGEYAFSNCDEVTSVTIGDCVTTIGQSAFMNCSGLTEVVLGDYVIEVGDDAFDCCYHLTKLTLGSGVARIGSYAFANCPLSEIICKPATPPVMADSSCFSCYDTATLRVHPAVAGSYRTTNYWNSFVNIVAEKQVNPAPGDMNGDGEVNVTDISLLISNLMNAN